MVATDPCELCAALFVHQSRTAARPLGDEVGVAVLVAQGAARFEALSELLAGGLQLLADQWRLSDAQLDLLSFSLRSGQALFRTWWSSPRPRWPTAGCCINLYAHTTQLSAQIAERHVHKDSAICTDSGVVCA